MAAYTGYCPMAEKYIGNYLFTSDMKLEEACMKKHEPERMMVVSCFSGWIRWFGIKYGIVHGKIEISLDIGSVFMDGFWNEIVTV